MAKKKKTRKAKGKTGKVIRAKGGRKPKNRGSRARKSAGITAGQYENLLAGIRSLHERLDMLQAEHSEMRELAGLEMASAEAAGGGGGGMVTLAFKKTAGPDNVRVTLMDSNEPVLLPFSTSGKSKPRAAGANIPAKVEVNGGASVVIDVTHSSPGQLNGRGEFPLTVLE